MENVLLLGATINKDRYANIAQKVLMEKGHKVFPVNPKYEEIEGIKCYKSIKDVKDRIDTVTVYLNSVHVEKMLDEIIEKKPKRVIFNPGTEDINLEKKLNENGIKTLHACTIVLLKTNQF